MAPGGFMAIALLAGQVLATAPSVAGSHLMAENKAVALIPGERVVLKIADDGTLTLLSANRLAPGAVVSPVPGPDGKIPPSAVINTAAPGRLVASFVVSRETGSLIKFESGVLRHLRYRAGIVTVAADQSLKTAPTSVCSILANKISFEHWEQPVFRVVFGGFADQPGETPVCR